MRATVSATSTIAAIGSGGSNEKGSAPVCVIPLGDAVAVVKVCLWRKSSDRCILSG